MKCIEEEHCDKYFEIKMENPNAIYIIEHVKYYNI